MKFLKHEFVEVASRLFLWTGTLAFCAFLLHAVAHLAVDDDEVRVAVYQTQSDYDNPDRIGTFGPAQSLLQEMANVRVLNPKMATTDIATQMLKDNADIAVTRTLDGWRFTLKSRS